MTIQSRSFICLTLSSNAAFFTRPFGKVEFLPLLKAGFWEFFIPLMMATFLAAFPGMEDFLGLFLVVVAMLVF